MELITSVIVPKIDGYFEIRIELAETYFIFLWVLLVSHPKILISKINDPLLFRTGAFLKSALNLAVEYSVNIIQWIFTQHTLVSKAPFQMSDSETATNERPMDTKEPNTEGDLMVLCYRTKLSDLKGV